ncbi:MULTISPECIES: LacI family DNA-binding transcriptional regulator [Limosilactobacillus]|jgi:LacI family transcriptional regulator|uniref:LacI family DNA-binding transcriptional regulator n=1 Tax=Limosilactobacillus TaxID=2742598 RepID=UPI0022477A1C|nr:LacI family DNA-binding transcriptional regulator [Limosilactobacillus pontis]MCX2186352.1 LacI family DNA-binding transcriptional regulator [Limosilactobacillus pontis]MCX2188038.1 LacI family DNA-binding transcriptional regulator [Limosilactobacillus pontis]
MASIRQIARLTGYSPATVSRVLNHDDRLAVKATTWEKIIQTAAALHYETHEHHGERVRAMNLQRSRILVLLTHQDSGPTSYFTEINRGIKMAAQEHGLPISAWLMFPQPDFDYRRAADYHALILVGTFSQHFLTRLYHYNQNLIIIDDYRYSDRYDLVRNNYEAVMHQALDQLYRQGHRHIFFIGGAINPVAARGSEQTGIADIRTRVYENWMQVHHLTAHTYVTRWIEADGHHAMTAILDRRLPIDALVIASDRLAVGAYQALHERGVSVPDNLAVVSFDDSAQAAQLTPPLSSIRPHSYEMGRAAVRLAIERLIDRRTVAEQVILPSRLVERASSAPQSK